MASRSPASTVTRKLPDTTAPGAAVTGLASDEAEADVEAVDGVAAVDDGAGEAVVTTEVAVEDAGEMVVVTTGADETAVCEEEVGTVAVLAAFVTCPSSTAPTAATTVLDGDDSAPAGTKDCDDV